MKNKKLPGHTDQEELPFTFNRRQISEKNIEKHWLRIASRITGAVLPKEINR
ncbi:MULTISPECIES: hypothetical protein [Pedobacter]|uniref:Uncharacterized protein n=1 Tax=Pedobacter zeae TaxID=1737356 RepID=A0A7W6K9A8_9SPHI|nr:hypothetical protein [Pedobacter zeae]MBB4107583.1 hypothetical protein [Pedobacter zeae]